MNNYRVLQALNRRHPKYISMYRFMRSTLTLQRQYEHRWSFKLGLPQINQSLEKIEGIIGQEFTATKSTSQKTIDEKLQILKSKLSELNIREIVG